MASRTRALVFLFVLMAAPVAASTITLTATWLPAPGPSALNSLNSGEAFSIEFDDSIGTDAGVLELSELVSFSGITYQVNDAGTLFSHSTVFDWPDIPGVAADTGFFSNTGWRFGDTSAQNTLAADLFSYDVRVSAVPLPSGLLLLLTGVGGLVLARRKTL